jgi:hypothetical protein
MVCIAEQIFKTESGAFSSGATRATCAPSEHLTKKCEERRHDLR